MQPLQTLTHIIRQSLCRRVNGGQSAADDHRRQAQLQIGDAVFARRTRQLQCHQKVRCLTHPARQTIGQIQYGGSSRSHAQGNVVKPHTKGIRKSQCATKQNAAINGTRGAPLQQQTQNQQKILIPTRSDAILGNAAKARTHPLIQVLLPCGHIMDGFKGDARAIMRNPAQMRGQRFNLETIHRHHIVSVIHQMVCQRVTRRTQSHHQNLITTGTARHRTSIIERIPPSQQRINLKAPRQRQHILENTRFHLRNIHRILFLINARLHAVIANAMPRSRQHGIINTRNRQCPNGQRILFCLVHLGYFLLKRTPRQLFAKNILMKKSLLIFFGSQALRTRILALMVAQNAIGHLRQCLTGVIALIGQRKSRARPQMRILIPLRAMSIGQRLQSHSVHGIHR